MRLPFIAILSVATAFPILAQNDDQDHRDRNQSGAVVEQRDQGRDRGRDVVVEKRVPERAVVVERHGQGREVVAERHGPGREVVVEQRGHGRQVVRYRGYSESPREWRRHHAREFRDHAYYSSHDRIILQSYSRRVPPGQMKMMHPEWRDRVIIGQPLPPEVIVEPVPVEVERQLPPLPRNYARFRLGTSFFIKDINTGVVIDMAF